MRFSDIILSLSQKQSLCHLCICTANPPSSSPSSSRSAAAAAFVVVVEQAGKAVTGLTAAFAAAAAAAGLKAKLGFCPRVSGSLRPSVRLSSAPTTFPFNRRSARQSPVKGGSRMSACVRAPDGGASPNNGSLLGRSVGWSIHLCDAWRRTPETYARSLSLSVEPIIGELV